MPDRTVFMDTSFVVALENRDDPYHARAQRLDRELLEEGCTLLLHWGVLLEIGDGYARIGRREKGIQLLNRLTREAGYRVQTLSESLVDDAFALYCSRRDKETGLTDCLSFVVMKEESVSDALTADIHFRQAGFRALLLE